MTVDVLARTRRNAACHRCGETITWFRTYPRNRWIAFDADPVALRTIGNPIRGEDMVEEIDAADIHWNRCKPEAEQQP